MNDAESYCQQQFWSEQNLFFEGKAKITGKQGTSTSNTSNQSKILFPSKTPSEEPNKMKHVNCALPESLDNTVICKVEANAISPQHDNPIHSCDIGLFFNSIWTCLVMRNKTVLKLFGCQITVLSLKQEKFVENLQGLTESERSG